MQGIRATQDVTDTKVSQAVLVCKVLESHRTSQTQRFLKRCYLYPNLTVVTCASVVFVVHTLTFHSYDSCSSQRNFLRDKIEVSEKAGSLGIEPRTPDLCTQCSATELQQPDNYQLSEVILRFASKTCAIPFLGLRGL